MRTLSESKVLSFDKICIRKQWGIKFVILVEEFDTGDLNSITEGILFYFSILISRTWCGKPMNEQTGSTILLFSLFEGALIIDFHAETTFPSKLQNP